MELYFTKKRTLIFVTIISSILGALLELLFLGSLYPFIVIILSPAGSTENELFNSVISFLPILSAENLIFTVTLLFISLTILTNLFRIFILWLNSRVSHSIGADFSKIAYTNLIYKDFLYHANVNSSELTSTLTRKIDLLTNYFILPSLTLFASLTSSLAIVFTLLIIDYRIALGSFIIFGFTYAFIGFLSKRKINKIGESIVISSDKIFNVIKESFSAIKEIIIYNNQDFFSEPYKRFDKEIKKKQAENIFFMLSPRYVVEGFGISLIAIFSAWLAISYENAIDFIPVLGVLALGAQRLIPQIQNVYTSWANITMSQKGLADLKQILESNKNPSKIENSNVSLKHFIEINSLDYSFERDKNVLENISLKIKKNTCIGFMGETGSGKTTLVNIIMGLIHSENGKIYIDKIPLTKKLLPNWRSQISFVPQRIFISDASFIDNIAFGEEPKSIDLNRIKKCCEKVHLDHFINSLPEKYETRLGENGELLSGGQIQRVGLARALYKNSSIIVIDEGTSALDIETEKRVMKSIFSLKEKTIILVAHRLETLSSCDFVYSLAKGRIEKSFSKEEFSDYIKKK